TPEVTARTSPLAVRSRARAVDAAPASAKTEEPTRPAGRRARPAAIVKRRVNTVLAPGFATRARTAAPTIATAVVRRTAPARRGRARATAACTEALATIALHVARLARAVRAGPPGRHARRRIRDAPRTS